MVSPRALAYASAGLAGGAILLVGLLNLGDPGYGRELLELLAALSPGYHAERTIESVFVATGYALCWGGAVGWLWAWLYNRVSSSRKGS